MAADHVALSSKFVEIHKLEKMKRKPYGCQLKLAKFWIPVLMQIVFLALSIDAQTSGDLDDCYPPTKIECGRQGWIHYTEAKCVEDNRCCWNRRNVPTCYYKATAKMPGPQCLVAPEVRVDCGDPTTKPQQCLNRGCCWNVTLHGKWCYYPNVMSSEATTPRQQTTIVTGAVQVGKNAPTCKCYIAADPLVRKFDGTKEVIGGVQSVVLYYNKQHQINVSVVLALGSGMWARSTVLDSAIVSKGGSENKIVFSRNGLKTYGNATQYDVISDKNPLKVQLRDDQVIGLFDYSDLFAKFDLEVPYESYYNDGGVCGVCPAAQG